MKIHFSLKMQTFENDATTVTDYSNYLDTQTIDFRWFLPFSIVNFNRFHKDDLKRYESDTKTSVDSIQSLRFQ